MVSLLEGKHRSNLTEDILQILFRSLVRDIPDCKTIRNVRNQHQCGNTISETS